MARYPLVAGIAKYSNPLLPPLSKTATDAVAVAEVLKQHGSYRVTLLNGEVTAKQLADALRTLLLEQAVKNEALIYFTGHGITGVTGVDSLEQPQGYLAASDCNVTKAGEQWIVRGGGISLNGLNQLIRQSDLSNLVVIFDSCHSGEFLERGLVENAVTVFRSRQDYYLITACRRFEQSWAKKSEQHSVFTGALLAGLSPERAGDNGQVTVDRLFDFIASDLSNSRQEPIRMGVGRSITLVQYPCQKTRVVVDETCPYQGLQAFDKEQARFFFGREKVIQLLVEKLGQANFVPIIGASGSGKSSVVRAGLIPQLEKNGWRVLEPILPGDEPLAELKTVLIELFGRTQGREVYSLVKMDGLCPVIERLSGSERLLLVVDQFEEVFTLCPKEEERRQFIDLLTQVAEIPNLRLAIVTTMRADFLEPCLSYESLTRLIQNEAVYMPPLLGAELEDAIATPAKLQGYRLETGLLGAILQDVGQEKGCLPLLQFALTELWERRDQQAHWLTVSQYQQLGGVFEALNGHAEKLYKRFTAQQQKWVKRIFLKLVRTGAGAKDTRQRQPKAKLLTLANDNPADQQVVSDVLEKLIQGRLLVTDPEPTGEVWIDLAHEALMEGWEEFVEWRQSDRQLRRLIDRIDDKLREWLKNPQDENLMMGGLLAQVEQRWPELEPYLDPWAREFYQRSDAYEQKENERRLAQKENERRINELNTYLTESVLKRFLPPSMVQRAARGELELDLSPEPRLITTLFSDIVGFTQLANTLRSRRVAELLNEYLAAMTHAVFDNGGTVDKFMGDGILAIFGAPEKLDPQEQARKAVATARQMLRALHKLNQNWQEQGIVGGQKGPPPVQFRCGIHQGTAVVGIFGGEERADYMAIGPSVNIASRLQEAAEPNSILVSAIVAEWLDDDQITKVSPLKLKGVDETVLTFSVKT